MKMDFKKTFQKLLKKSVVILKYAPDVSRFIIQKAMDMRVVTGIYNFLERQNNVTKINIEKSKEFFLSQKEKIEENIGLLSDEFSKKTYINMFHYRCTYRNKFVQEIALKSKYQYLDDAINFNMYEVFVDVGAFFGETTNAIYKLMCKKHSKSAVDFTSLIIEPDDFNYKICCKKFSKKSFCVLSENCAVGAYEGTAQFSGGLLGSCKINSNSSETVAISTVDALCDKHNIIPTYIKFDIEGGERDALKGSQHIIELFKPCLAISIYHSDEDMVEIIRDISCKYDFYNFYIRHYSGFFADTVLFCVPKNKSLN